jgi:hypothetical protein
MSVQAFYGELAPLYHLVYENWEASVARQGTALASLISEHWGAGARTVLDAAVGIGTLSAWTPRARVPGDRLRSLAGCRQPSPA